MKNFLWPIVLLFLSAPASAQITSTFDTNADGWTFIAGAPITVNHQATNGNPGGYVSVTYSSNATATSQGWFAPAKFLGNQVVRSLGMNIRFDMQQSQAGTSSNGNGDIRIESISTRLVYSLPVKPVVAPGWSSYLLKLDETQGWRLSSTTGALATRAQISQVLSSITSIEIRGTFATNASYTSGIDNVILEQRTLQIAPTITSFSPTSGQPGTSITVNGNNFDPIASNNAVYFGAVAGTITNASATQLTITIPIGAQYGNITVINKTTGVAKQSDKPFNPTFTDGGRIIPSSFKPKVDFLLGTTAGNDVNGIRVADLDGDGWNDILVTESTPASVSIFRNLGAGGVISAASFSSKMLLAGGGASGGLSIIDLDGDGKLDIVAANGSTFSTFRNISTPGNLTFEPVENWSMANSGVLSNVVDVDGDGRPELIGQHRNGSVAADFWITQNISSPGNIEFGSSVSYFGGSTLDAGGGVGLGDLDNDGKPELLVSHGFGDRFSILKNNSTPGTINLTNLGTIVTSQYNSGLSVADFNLDGKNDIVWKRTGTNSVYMRTNTNSGGPLAITDFATEFILTGDLGTYGGMSIADINGDGKPDIVASDNADVGVFENVFDGGVFDATAFVPAYQYQGSGTSTYPTSPIVADLNGDQKPDMIVGVTNSSPLRVSIYENKNVHTPEISINTVSPLAAPVGATLTITGDYFSTVASENHVRIGGMYATVLTATKTQLTVQVPAGLTYGLVSVTRDQLTSTYRLPFKTTFSPGASFDNTHFAAPVEFTLTAANYDIDAGDLNRDGKPDILAEGTGSYVFKNIHTTGPITSASLIADDTLSGSFMNPKLEDFDGDGYLDVIAVNGLYRKNNSTSIEISFLPNVGLGIGASNVDFADFNADGKIDMTLTSIGGGQLTLLENRTTYDLANFTTGTFSSFSQSIPFAKPSVGGGVATADFDNDGLMDVVATNPASDNISIFRNAGVLKIDVTQFDARVDVTVSDNPGRIYKGDLDADGKMDLVMYYGTGANASLISVFHNTSTVGTISFSRFDLTMPSASTVAHIDDIDGDGKPEVLVTSESGNRFSIFKNLHTTGALTAASFAAPFNTTVTAPRGLFTSDLNLDGKPEIILTRAAGLLVVYENLIPTVFITITQQPTSPNYACEGASTSFTTAATGTTNITYQWQKFDGSVYVDLVNNTTFAGATSATLTINNVSSAESGEYQCVISGDLAADVTTNSTNLVFNSLPSPPDVVNGVSCGAGVLTLTASGGSPGDYRWYTDSPLTLIAGEEDETFVTPSLSTNTTYHISLVDTFCESVPVPITAIISSLPAQPVITSTIAPVGNAVTICSTTALTLSAPNGFSSYLWSNGATTQQISVTASGTYSVTVTNADGCSSPASEDITVTVIPAPCNNTAPVINTTALSTVIDGLVTIDLIDLISDVDDNLEISSLAIIDQPTSGASASITGTVLQINYVGTSFTGTDLITIQVCDVFSECTSQQFEINVIGEIEIFNAMSANGDMLNPVFLIQNIHLLPDTQNNKVTIYNRWGSKVFEVENYNNTTNVFKGFNDNGNELPSGTYFYKIVFPSTQEKEKTGYLVLKR